MKAAFVVGAAGRLLPEGRAAGPMPWVIAIMMFLTVLAAAAALALGGAASRLDAGNRITVQVVEAEPGRREAQAAAALALLRRQPGLVSVRRVPDQEMSTLLEPWLGSGGIDAGIAVPALIEAELSPEAMAGLGRLRSALQKAAPAARLDDNALWLAPVERLIAALRLLAAGLVLLTAAAAAATVALAARAALDTHRETIEVLHLMGATDGQIARLFQRRIAFDALFGGLIGLAAAALVLWLLGRRLTALGSELIGAVALPPYAWLLLLLLPLAGVGLAMLVARLSILRALKKAL